MCAKLHLAIAIAALVSMSSTVRGQTCTAGSIESDGHTERWMFGNDDVGAYAYFRIRGEKQDEACWIQSPYTAYSPRHLSVSLRGRTEIQLLGNDIELFDLTSSASVTNTTRNAGLTIQILGAPSPGRPTLSSRREPRPDSSSAPSLSASLVLRRGRRARHQDG